ncbi:hypothetical protein OsI_03425 [Oryza sativa Indica Group]|uniref:Uncharacterized protein n=1 Tax=Oryza sativa subsp. indica TaxID=39946 RepID=A2WU75_ORYSI|nr:hypothetical protein OsI_03425 [Oryza sativa Indica Group]
MEAVPEVTGVDPGDDEVSEDARGGGGGAVCGEATEAAGDSGRRPYEGGGALCRSWISATTPSTSLRPSGSRAAGVVEFLWRLSTTEVRVRLVEVARR